YNMTKPAAGQLAAAKVMPGLVARLSAATLRLQQLERLLIQLPAKEGLKGAAKERLRWIGKREQRQARAKLHRIQLAQHRTRTLGLMQQHCPYRLTKPLAQHRVRKIGARFRQPGQAITLSSGTAPQPPQLGEHIPDPVCAFVAGAELGQGRG